MKRAPHVLFTAGVFFLLNIFGFSQTTPPFRMDIGTKLLVPSSAKTSNFTSLLVVLNMDSTGSNNIVITARNTSGSVIGTPIHTTLPVKGRYRSPDILGAMGAPLGAFGPITIESTNKLKLAAVSEVASVQGPAGFFPGVNVNGTFLKGFITEVDDTGDSGTPATHRTNLGINTVNTTPANITITLFNNAGVSQGSTTTTVAGDGMQQLNSVIRTIMNSAGATGQNGHLELTSNQPILAWASKIDNETGDPSFEIGIGAAAGTIPAAARMDIGTKLLVPSSAKTSNFTSLLVVLNMDTTASNDVQITARNTSGGVIGTPISTILPVGGRYRSPDILGAMGAPLGSFGPITIESTNKLMLAAVSEVASVQGPAGFFPGVNVNSTFLKGFITEVEDSGDPGTAATHRTNLGINTVSATPANVAIALYNNAGTQLGSTSTTVAGNGMQQLNSVIRTILSSAGPTGQNGYLELTSNQPILAWASKIDNDTGDPSFEIGIGDESSGTISAILPGVVDYRNYFLTLGLALSVPLLMVFTKWGARIMQELGNDNPLTDPA
jgi:hypothetical protein